MPKRRGNFLSCQTLLSISHCIAVDYQPRTIWKGKRITSSPVHPLMAQLPSPLLRNLLGATQPDTLIDDVSPIANFLPLIMSQHPLQSHGKALEHDPTRANRSIDQTHRRPLHLLSSFLALLTTTYIPRKGPRARSQNWCP